MSLRDRTSARAADCRRRATRYDLWIFVIRCADFLYYSAKIDHRTPFQWSQIPVLMTSVETVRQRSRGVGRLVNDCVQHEAATRVVVAAEGTNADRKRDVDVGSRIIRAYGTNVLSSVLMISSPTVRQKKTEVAAHN